MDLTENIVNDALDRYPNEYPNRLKAETLRELANIERAAYIRGRKDERQLRESQSSSTSDEALRISDVSKPLSIKLEDWHYQCDDGCCDMYGTEIALNGKKCDNQYAGDDVRTALESVLTELGYEVDIDVC